MSLPSSLPSSDHFPTHGLNDKDITNRPPPLLPSAPLPLLELCASISERIDAFLAQKPADDRVAQVQQQTRTALAVIREAFKRYSVSELAIAYNGGKDCLVLLVLFLAALHNHPSLSATPPPPLQSVYIVSPHPFREVDDFVASTAAICSLKLWRAASGMKDAFAAYLSSHPQVKAIFVGTRRTDPHGATLTHFDRTDHGWPDFMRIHPVIDWHYVDIWTFILTLRIPYCALYDMGYTSLGGTTDTHRNPALRRASTAVTPNPTSTCTSAADNPAPPPRFEYRPAYELVEDGEERLGRDWERRGRPGDVVQTPVEEKPDLARSLAQDEADVAQPPAEIPKAWSGVTAE